MKTIYFDSSLDDALRREQIYGGQIFVYSPGPATVAFCEFAREMVQEAFGGLNPREAQYHLPVAKYVAILAELKPKFTHHPKSKEFVKGIIGELGCDLSKTYFDVVRLRCATSGGYLTAGLGYAFHPHRDTWYCAPFSQLNWWFPLYDIESENAMAFHPQYWGQAVPNSSSDFNIYEYNSDGRKNAAQHIKSDTRKQPKPLGCIESDPQIRILSKVGGITIFSAAHMHSTVPNASGKTRFSIDFRTVHIDDVIRKAGACNIDSACAGTTLRDFLRATDLARIPEDIAGMYDKEPPRGGDLIFQTAMKSL